MTVSFDRVAHIYDATRWSGIPVPVMEKILNAMKEGFRNCQSILDVGVGTGRFAQYFNESGFAVVGVDVSLSMMKQAQAKGVRDLVRADGHYLPFRDGSFDGSLMIHVLHLVKDWVWVVREVGRVTKNVLISEAGDIEGFSARQRYLELRAEMGYPLDRFNDAELGLRRLIRPKFVVPAGDYWTEVDADDEINSFESRKSSVMWDVPDDVHSAIMKRLRTEYGGKKLRRRDMPEVVGWDPAHLRAYKP
jgi:SAM-dependent methyltransferase